MHLTHPAHPAHLEEARTRLRKVRRIRLARAVLAEARTHQAHQAHQAEARIPTATDHRAGGQIQAALLQAEAQSLRVLHRAEGQIPVVHPRAEDQSRAVLRRGRLIHRAEGRIPRGTRPEGARIQAVLRPVAARTLVALRRVHRGLRTRGGVHREEARILAGEALREEGQILAAARSSELPVEVRIPEAHHRAEVQSRAEDHLGAARIQEGHRAEDRTQEVRLRGVAQTPEVALPEGAQIPAVRHLVVARIRAEDHPQVARIPVGRPNDQEVRIPAEDHRGAVQTLEAAHRAEGQIPVVLLPREVRQGAVRTQEALHLAALLEAVRSLGAAHLAEAQTRAAAHLIHLVHLLHREGPQIPEEALPEGAQIPGAGRRVSRVNRGAVRIQAVLHQVRQGAVRTREVRLRGVAQTPEVALPERAQIQEAHPQGVARIPEVLRLVRLVRLVRLEPARTLEEAHLEEARIPVGRRLAEARIPAHPAAVRSLVADPQEAGVLRRATYHMTGRTCSLGG